MNNNCAARRRADKSPPVQNYAVPPPRDDERLVASVANSLLDDLHVYRCVPCGLVLLQRDPLYKVSMTHRQCGGRWKLVEEPLARTVLVRFLTREMLSGGPRWERPT